MEAKDTVMSDEEIGLAIAKEANGFYPYRLDPIQRFQIIAQAQSEISFKDGKQAGIREVVEFAIRCRSETQEEIRKHPKKTWKLCVDRIIGYTQRKCG